MKKTFGGPVVFLDRSDINTDEIIPAKYLTEVTKEALKPYCLEDLKLEGFDPKGEVLKNARAVVSRANFGCGSCSRSTIFTRSLPKVMHAFSARTCSTAECWPSNCRRPKSSDSSI